MNKWIYILMSKDNLKSLICLLQSSRRSLLYLKILRLLNTVWKLKGLIPDYEHALGLKSPIWCFFNILSSNENLAYTHLKKYIKCSKLSLLRYWLTHKVNTFNVEYFDHCIPRGLSLKCFYSEGIWGPSRTFSSLL